MKDDRKNDDKVEHVILGHITEDKVLEGKRNRATALFIFGKSENCCQP